MSNASPLTSSSRKQTRRKRTIGRPRGNSKDRDLKRKILLAATRLFGERGYEGTSLKLISDSVGITAPALYHHFKNKRKLLYECLLREIEEMVRQCQEPLAELESADPGEQLRVFAIANAKFQIREIQMQPIYNMVLFGSGASTKILTAAQKRRLRAVQRKHYENLRNILERGVVEGVFEIGDLTVTCFSLFALAEHVNTWYDPEGAKTPEQIASSIAALSAKMVSRRRG